MLMFLFVFWLTNRPSIKYIRNQENGGGGERGGAVIQNVYRCVQGERSKTPHVFVRTYTISFHVFGLWCLLFVEIYLSFIQEGCFFQKWLFFSNEINFCCKKIKVFRSKVSQTFLILIKQNLNVYSLDVTSEKPCVAQHGDLFDKVFNIDFYRACYCCCYCHLMLLLQQLLN